MEQDRNAKVEDYRRRIKAQAEVTRQLEELVRGLEGGPAAQGGAQTEASLRRARADFERSESDLRALQREYACFRLREAVGADGTHVEDALFDDAIHTVTSGRLTRHETRRPSDGPIAFDAFRALLLADLPLGQLVENEAADRKSSVTFEPSSKLLVSGLAGSSLKPIAPEPSLTPATRRRKPPVELLA